MQLWSANTDKGFIHHRIDDVTVCYNPLTGQTHILNELPFEIFTLLTKTPLSMTDLLKKVNQQLSPYALGNIDSSVQTILEQLTNEELVILSEC